ncbi:MAG: hypothetical protein HOO89_03270 [Ferruginibacter sp.]|nr:hypothetical protein [Ferruginibacter sp.]
MAIKYFTYKDIDKTKWDACVINAHNSLIYVHSFYLDNCTNKNWDALILNDYEAVLPITFRKKIGIKYLYQPAFLQQAGIFSANVLSKELINEFILLLMSKFKFAEINFNYATEVYNTKLLNVTNKNNFIISLHKNIGALFFSCNDNFKKNVKRASNNFFEYIQSDNVEEAIFFYKDLYHKKMHSLTSTDYKALILNATYLQKQNNLIIRNIYYNNIKYATIVLLKYNNRLYNVASSVTIDGRKLRANYFLFYKVMEEFSNQNLILDFEGSDIDGIASFYQSMNPINQHYFFVKYNNLPWYIKFFKR